VVSCSILTKQSVTYPQNLQVIITKDEWVCLSPESAKKLAEFKADLEKL